MHLIGIVEVDTTTFYEKHFLAQASFLQCYPLLPQDHRQHWKESKDMVIILSFTKRILSTITNISSPQKYQGNEERKDERKQSENKGEKLNPEGTTWSNCHNLVWLLYRMRDGKSHLIIIFFQFLYCISFSLSLYYGCTVWHYWTNISMIQRGKDCKKSSKVFYSSRVKTHGNDD